MTHPTVEATPDFRLADFPGLSTVDIFCGFATGRAWEAAALLGSVGASNRIEDLHIGVSVIGTLDDDSLRHLDSTLSALPMPALRTVHVSISGGLPGWAWMSPADADEWIARMSTLRLLLPKLDARGYLRLSHDGALLRQFSSSRE